MKEVSFFYHLSLLSIIITSGCWVLAIINCFNWIDWYSFASTRHIISCFALEKALLGKFLF